MDLESTRAEDSKKLIKPDKRCEAIVQRFGDKQKLAATWSPISLRYISDNIDTAIRTEVPSLVMFIKTYTEESVVGILKSMVTLMLTRTGDTKLDEFDVDCIARGVCASSNARTLCFASVVSFFQRVMNGEFKLYSYNTINVLNAFDDYCTKMHKHEAKIKSDVESERREQEYKEHLRNSITFDEYKKRKGLTDIENPFEHFFGRK